jgi:hypothetical protein
MFKQFLMDNAQHNHIQYLFRWWNGHIFSFNILGKTGREDPGDDSRMDDTLKALNSDEDYGDDADSWYMLEEPEIQHKKPAINLFNLTISDDGLIPPAAPTNTIVAPQICESTPRPTIIAPRICAPHHHSSTCP